MPNEFDRVEAAQCKPKHKRTLGVAEVALIALAIMVIAVVALALFGGPISQFVQNPPLSGNQTAIP